MSKPRRGASFQEKCLRTGIFNFPLKPVLRSSTAEVDPILSLCDPAE